MMTPVNEQLAASGFLKALKSSWSRESCWPPMQHSWNEQNPAQGNCLVSVLALWADTGFKGKIVPDLAQQPEKKNADWHFHIELSGSPVDLTRQQFTENTEIESLSENTQMYGVLVRGSFFDHDENKSLRDRLQLLLGAMSQHGYQPPHIATEIIDRLEQEFQKFKPAPSRPRT